MFIPPYKHAYMPPKNTAPAIWALRILRIPYMDLPWISPPASFSQAAAVRLAAKASGGSEKESKLAHLVSLRVHVFFHAAGYLTRQVGVGRWLTDIMGPSRNLMLEKLQLPMADRGLLLTKRLCTFRRRLCAVSKLLDQFVQS